MVALGRPKISTDILKSWHENAVCITDPLYRESPVMGGFPSYRAGITEFWWFVCCYPKKLLKRVAGDLRRHGAPCFCDGVTVLNENGHILFNFLYNVYRLYYARTGLDYGLAPDT